MQAEQEEFLTDLAATALVEEVLQCHGAMRIRVNGTSMWPALRSGDVLTIASCNEGDLAEGTIVLVRRDSRLFAHRIVNVCAGDAGRHVITRGDAHAHADAPIPRSSILGRAVRIERGGRQVVLSGTPRAYERPFMLAVGMCAGAMNRLRHLYHGAVACESRATDE